MKYLSQITKDRKSRVPRIWSNKVLKKHAKLFSGSIVNVSGWKDLDKQGKRYRDYFKNANKYSISNYETDARGFQGDLENEFFLDLEKELPKKLKAKFDVVFNHTTLEHIFHINKAFSNLCEMSKDIVILVVPFMQEQHAEYGDYWRFTPMTIKRLFESNNMRTIYMDYNDQSSSSIYLYAIGSKNPKKWISIIRDKNNKISKNCFIGKKIIRNSPIYYFSNIIQNFLKK